MEFFIGYKHEDLSLAKEVKKQVEALAHSAFVARYDLIYSVEWRNEIREHLDNCNALIVIATSQFNESAFANQEAGIIMGKKKPVISLKFSGELPGLLES